MSNNSGLTVWILQTGEPLHTDQGKPRPMRAMNLANSLVDAGHNVILWSSAFYHQEKSHRTLKYSSVKVSTNLEIRLIPSPGYNANIGFARLWDHAAMGKNLSNILGRQQVLPDIAFIGYPPIEPAYVMANWLRKKGIKYIIDIKDQWPHVFVEAFPKKVSMLGKLAFSPYFYMGKKTLTGAAGLCSMSESFLSWSLSFAGRARNSYDMVVPLTTRPSDMSSSEKGFASQWWDDQNIKDNGIPKIIFVGSHSRAFDMETVIGAAEELQKISFAVQFIICGSGPFSETWKLRASGLENVIFCGWINEPQIITLSQRAVATIAPYQNTENFVLNIPNKIVDSLANNLPLISSLEGEVKALIETYEIGFFYDNCQSLVDAVQKISVKEIQTRISENCRKLYHSKFSYDTVYGNLIQQIERLKRNTK